MISCKRLQQLMGVVTVLMVTSASVPAFAETTLANPSSANTPSDGYAMVGWFGALGIVEQLQTIHRLSQSSSPNALLGLISALNSQFPLARRKASRGLLEKVRTLEPVQKKQVVQQIEGSLESKDPVVQKNLVRLLADINTTESQNTLKSFFSQSRKESQMNAVEGLTLDKRQHQKTLQMVKQVSPYTDVRQVVSETLD